jgi:hypothetical protein
MRRIVGQLIAALSNTGRGRMEAFYPPRPLVGHVPFEYGAL